MQMKCLNHFYLALFNRASTSLLGSSILFQSSRVTCLERRTRVITNSTSLGFIYPLIATRYWSDQPDQPVIPKDFHHFLFFSWQERLVPSFETESSLSRVPWWTRCRVWSSLESESKSSNSWTPCSRSVRGKTVESEPMFWSSCSKFLDAAEHLYNPPHPSTLTTFSTWVRHTCRSFVLKNDFKNP